METLSYVVVVVVCLGLSAFFSTSETALLRLQGHELEEDLQAARGPAAFAVRDLLNSTSRLLVTILLGNNLVNIMAASFTATLGARYLGDWGVLISAILLTIVVFVFCEVLPKAIAAQHSRRVAYAVAMPLYVVHQALRPLHLLYDRIVGPLVKSMGGSVSETPMSSGEEVMRLARQIPDSDVAGSPLSIIGAAAGAAELTVMDIMVPRTEIFSYPVDTAPSELLDRILEERYTRVPVYEGTIDKIVGVVHLKDLVELVRGEGSNLRGILKQVLHVPERKPILRLLADMQRSFVHLAIVQDEFGVTLGMVTQEDILEELVGEIRDEHDREELLTIRKVDDSTYLAVGRVKILDFSRQTGWKLEGERGDTLAGLLFNTLGRAPRKGETIHVPGYELMVTDLSGTRVTQVRVTRLVEEHATDAP
jgi:CBS domain containing-hemolysin-like protein